VRIMAGDFQLRKSVPAVALEVLQKVNPKHGL
jgi:hypothetical protein